MARTFDSEDQAIFMNDDSSQKDSFAALFEGSAGARSKPKRVAVGETVEAVVLRVGQREVFLELDGKRQAFIEIEEVRDSGGDLALKEGDTVRARVLEIDRTSGTVRLGPVAPSRGQTPRVEIDVAPGSVVRGTVTAVRDFGAFVDIGGVEGLIPRSEVGHDRSVAVADVLKAGDTVEVVVREVKDVPPKKPGASTKAITLSLKAMTADPWAELDLAPGLVMKGTVVRSVEFGRFVRIAPGVEGLLHVSELGAKGGCEEGEEVLVVVRKVDRVAKKIALGLAPEGKTPGSIVATTASVAIGAVVQGVVDRIENYGLFVQLEGVSGRAGRGLVPNAEVGVPRGTDLRKVFPLGTKVTAKVLETGEGKLRLSIRGAKEAEERAVFEEARDQKRAPTSLGTFADLLKKKR